MPAVNAGETSTVHIDGRLALLTPRSLRYQLLLCRILDSLRLNAIIPNTLSVIASIFEGKIQTERQVLDGGATNPRP